MSLNSENFRPLFVNILPVGFINGTFGYREKYENIPSINYLIISVKLSSTTNGYIYLDWVVATFGVPYEVTVP